MPRQEPRNLAIGPVALSFELIANWTPHWCLAASFLFSHLRCETLVKVHSHQAVKLIPSSYQSIANPASSRRPFASFQYPREPTWTRSYHEGDLVVPMLALSGLPFADNRRHGRYAIECMVQRNTAQCAKTICLRLVMATSGSLKPNGRTVRSSPFAHSGHMLKL